MREREKKSERPVREDKEYRESEQLERVKDNGRGERDRRLD